MTPLPAATVLLLRSADAGVEVLMVERSNRGFFGGLMAFPGGSVEEADLSPLARRVVRAAGEDHHFRAAALRELAEEVGIALTTDGPRPAVEAKGGDLYARLEEEGLFLDGGSLVLVSRWVTPDFAPRRYDAMFYATELTTDVGIRLDEEELVGHRWITPSLALSRARSGNWRMFMPTTSHLSWLQGKGSVADALSSAAGAGDRTLEDPAELGDGSVVPISIPGQER